MKRYWLVGKFCWMLLVVTGGAQAYPLDLLPRGEFAPGNSVGTLIGVTGMNRDGAPSVGAFSAELSFENLTFVDVTFFEHMGAPDTDLGMGVAPPFQTDIYVDASTPMKLYLDQLSLASTAELDRRQGVSVELALLSFRVTGALGDTARIELRDAVVSDALGFRLPTTLPPPFATTIRPPALVPEPASPMLWLAGMLAVFIGRRMVRRREV